MIDPIPVTKNGSSNGTVVTQGWLRRLAGYCWRYRGSVFLAFGASLLGMAVAAGVPLIERLVVDQAVLKRTQPLIPWVLVLVGAGVVRFGLSYVRRYVGGRLSLDVQHDLRTAVFGALHRLDGASQDDLNTGQVVSRSISDITLVQGLLSFLPMVTGNVLLFVISLVIMLVLSPLLTLVALAVGPALWFIAVLSRKKLFPATWAAQQQAGEIAGVVEASVTGVRVVKGFGQEERELDRLDAEARTLFGLRLRAVRFTSRYNPALAAVPALGQVGVLLLGGYLAAEGKITLGTFLAFSTYVAQLVGPVRMLAALLTVGQQARASVERVFEVIDSTPKVVDAPDAKPLPAGEGRVEFDNVFFGYAASQPVLCGLSLTVEPGETLALVGGAGSGKSTISLLLPRFYDVQGGSVRVDGVDVRDTTMASLRSHIGVVFEESFLFSDSVASNIAYGRPDATQDQIYAAAQAAEADGFIRALPHGYDTVVGEQGLTLSGGQRQRVALARALLSDPQILLLDDATSAIDARIEAEIHETLRKLMHGRTTLLVAHRRSTLALADRIAVLEGGVVIDTGTEDELLARCPLFRRLLAGPGDDVEGAEVEVDPADVSEEQVNGITPSLWRADPSIELTPEQRLNPTPSLGGGGGPGGGGGMLAGVPPSPALLAKVAALAPATDTPNVAPETARQADPAFGLLTVLRGVRRGLLIGLGLVALDALAQIALPALVRIGVDRGVTHHHLNSLYVISGVALLVVLADWVASAAQTLVTGRTGERLLYTLRVKTFAQLQRLGLDYYERELSGRIMTRMTTDVDALSTFFQTGLATAVVSILSFAGVLVAILVLDWELGLVIVALLPILAVATLMFRRRSTVAYTEARERVSSVNADFQEKVAGVRVAQAYGREGDDADRFGGLSSEYRTVRLRAQRYIAIYFPFVEMLSEVAAALVLGFGAARVHNGGLTAGGLIAYLLYLDLLFTPVQQLSQVFDGYQQAEVGLRRIRDLLRTPTSVPPATHPEAAAGASRQPLSGQRRLHLRTDHHSGGRRGHPHHPTGSNGRPGRRDRRGQIHPGQARGALLRPDRGLGLRRRDRSARGGCIGLSPPARGRAAGGVPVQRHDPRRDRLCTAGSRSCRGRSSRPGRRCPHHDRAAARRLPAPRRRAWTRALRGSASADRAGSRAARAARDPAAGRGDGCAGPRHRIRGGRGHRAARRAAYHPRRGAPADHRGLGRPGDRDGRRTRSGRRHPRGAARPRRVLRADVVGVQPPLR